MDVLFSLQFFAFVGSLDSAGSGPCAALLHLAATLFELTAPVIVVISLPELASQGDGQAVHAEVDTKDRLMPGLCRNFCCVIAVVSPCRDV